MSEVTKYWYQPATDVPFKLRFLAGVFSLVSGVRKKLYRVFPFRVYRAPIPVVVIGNIFVGGTGKTPLVIALVNLLRAEGLKPGIVSRGYGGNASHWPQVVTPDSHPTEVGDEPVLLANKTECPIVVDPNRSNAIKKLLADNPDLDLVLSDDGLQHYAMARDIELVVIDGDRRFGNGLVLPAGPLRESMHRLESVDFRIVNGGNTNDKEYYMRLGVSEAYQLDNPKNKISLNDFSGKKVHSLAGIGNPNRFFRALKEFKIEQKAVAFSDHYDFKQEDLDFEDDLPILMTEKDAVKCKALKTENVWVVPAETRLDKKFQTRFVKRINEIVKR